MHLNTYIFTHASKVLAARLTGKVPVSQKSHTKSEISRVYVSLLGSEDHLQRFAKAQADYTPKPDFLRICKLTETTWSMHVNFPETTSVEEVNGFLTAAFDERLIYELTHPDLEGFDQDAEDDED